MNRLRDYTRLIRMYGGALQTEELALDLTELKAYRDKLLEFVPSINMTTRRSPVFTSTQLALLNPELSRNTAPAFTVDTDLDAPYAAAARTSLPPKVQLVLNRWNDVLYGYSASTDLIPVQDWILRKLVEVLETIDALSKGPASTRAPPPTKAVRVGPSRGAIPPFEDALIDWLKGTSGSKIPTDGEFANNDDWAKVDVQTLEAYGALTDRTKVGILIDKLAPLYKAKPAINEAFGMQLGLLSTYE